MILQLFTACISDEDRRINETLAFAGDNREELEKVLSYYEDKGETRKWKAARFLIANMKDKFSYDIPDLDSIRQALVNVKTQNVWDERWKGYRYKQLPKIYDAQVITADYLIENIELAFESWQRYGWGKRYSFDDFCKYLLPYRVGDEPLERWREEYRDCYVPLLDSLYRGTDVIEAASVMQHYAEHAGYKYYANFSIPHQGAPFLKKCWVGTCRDYCDFIVYLFRTLGIPVATDCMKYSPEVRHGHEWNAVKDTTGLFVPIEFHDSAVKRDWENKRRKGKIYRYTFEKQAEPTFDGNYYMRDVTEEYFGKNCVEFPIDENTDGFIAVFAFEGWKPIARYECKRGKGVVRNIEPENIFMPVIEKNGQLVENGFPFMWDGKKAIVLAPDVEKKEKVRLTRKYPVTMNLKNHLYRMNGTCIEGSDLLDFAKADTLVSIQDSALSLKRFLKSRREKKYRYVRFSPPHRLWLEMAELYVFSDTAFTERVGCKIIPGTDSSYKDFYRASDDDWLTYYWVYTRGASLVLDLGKSTKIGSFLFVPRNDDNYVKKGEYYELMYQNGANGWASLGRKVAEEDYIDFEDVPANALLRLHHCTKGVEEQVFLWKDGKQYFLGHLR